MDSNPDAYAKQPENAIAVVPWQGDPNDQYLSNMIPFLESMFNYSYINLLVAIVILNVPDVRPLLQDYYGTDIPRKFADAEAKLREKMRMEWEEKKKKGGLKSLIGGTVQQVHS